MARQNYVTIVVYPDKGLLDSIKLKKPQDKLFMEVVWFIKEHRPKASELEAEFGITVFNVLRKLVNSGMVEKVKDRYVLSSKFSDFLRKFAEEWEEFVREGGEDVKSDFRE